MDKEEIEKLLEIANNEESAALTTLYNAKVKCLKEYQGDHTAAKLRDWQAAETALKGLCDELEAKYFNKATVFKNISEVLLYLKAEGYKIEKSKLYQDAKRGKLKTQADGMIKEDDVKLYAIDLPKISDKNGVLDEIQQQKAQKEVEKLQAQIDKFDFELSRDKGKYVLRAEVDQENAIRAGAFDAGLKHLFQTRFRECIVLVGGDPKKTQVAIDFWSGEIDQLLNEFAGMDEIRVVADLEEKRARGGGGHDINH